LNVIVVMGENFAPGHFHRLADIIVNFSWFIGLKLFHAGGCVGSPKLLDPAFLDVFHGVGAGQDGLGGQRVNRPFGIHFGGNHSLQILFDLHIFLLARLVEIKGDNRFLDLGRRLWCRLLPPTTREQKKQHHQQQN
jgi:hypothetical protein